MSGPFSRERFATSFWDLVYGAGLGLVAGVWLILHVLNTSPGLLVECVRPSAEVPVCPSAPMEAP